uniref:Uncharacterized protein n=1 Tax=Anguilla anguilla TaxID=7936 RepID=A0A0E9R089_ANGAN
MRHKYEISYSIIALYLKEGEVRGKHPFMTLILITSVLKIAKYD